MAYFMLNIINNKVPILIYGKLISNNSVQIVSTLITAKIYDLKFYIYMGDWIGNLRRIE